MKTFRSRRVRGAAAVALTLGAAALAAAPVQAATEVVKPSDMNGWTFLNEGSQPAATGAFSPGPGAPPGLLGLGSLRFKTVNSADGQAIIRPLAPVRLANISALSYRTFRRSGDPATAVALQLNVDYNVTDANTGWQGRLVYEPYRNGTVTTGTWQTWTPSAGTAKWWATGAPGNSTCGQATPCTWTQLKAAHPNIGLNTSQPAVVLKAGAGWVAPFDGSADALVFNTNVSSTTYDFEADVCTTDCYVDPAGDDDNLGDSAASPTKTVQAAFNRVAPGGTVHIAAGTYNEDTQLVKPNVKVIGAGADQTIVSGVTGGSFDTMQLSATADGSSVEDLTITRAGNAAGTWNTALNNQGFALYGDDVAVRRTKVTGNRNGVYVSRAKNLVLEDNVIDFNRTGLHTVGDVTGLRVENNFLTNNWTMGILFRNEPDTALNPTTTVTVNDNDISGNWYSQVEARSLLPNAVINAERNWFGADTAPTVGNGYLQPNGLVTSGEEAYASQIPAEFGGTKTAANLLPGVEPKTVVWNLLVGNTANPVDSTPWRCNDADTLAAIGFQPDNDLANDDFWQDSDNDGFGSDTSVTEPYCDAPSGYKPVTGDANDADASIYPGAPELCDGKDNDQDGETDEGVKPSWYADEDGDGFGAGDAVLACSAPAGHVGDNTDADDTDDTVYPNAPELCDGKDNDQDGDTDEGVTARYYEDADGDTLGNPAVFVDACEAPAGYVENDGDADDTHNNQYTIGAFLAPVDNAAINTAKGGQTVPVKVRVTDSEGNPVSTDPGLTLDVDSASCPSSTTLDAVETFAANASGWEYKGDGVWQTNWKTTKGWSGCRTLTVDINTVTDSRQALFLFK